MSKHDHHGWSNKFVVRCLDCQVGGAKSNILEDIFRLCSCQASSLQLPNELRWSRSTARRDSLRSEYDGAGKVALLTRVHHEAKPWLVLTHRSNASSTVTWTAVLVDATTFGSAFTPSIDKRYGERIFSVFLRMDSGERHKIDCSSGI